MVGVSCLIPDLTFVSLMAGNADEIYSDLMDNLRVSTGLHIRIIDTPSWNERMHCIEHSRNTIAAVCGAVYTEYVHRGEPAIQLLAAPVMRKARYGNKAVYFSDVVVRAGAPFRSFADLMGATWAYNETRSFSGYIAMDAYLAARGHSQCYFGRVYETGSHQRSLEAVIAGEADLTAIDSIVLERALALEPALQDRIRTILSIGPYPVPPLVVSRHVDANLVAILQAALLGMHHHTAGARLLERAQVSQFITVDDDNYDPIRQQTAISARLQSVRHSPLV